LLIAPNLPSKERKIRGNPLNLPACLRYLNYRDLSFTSILMRAKNLPMYTSKKARPEGNGG
jgi:hypothetical protein